MTAQTSLAKGHRFSHLHFRFRARKPSKMPKNNPRNYMYALSHFTHK